MPSEIYYGVTQSVHGHAYRWIFEKSVLDKNMYDGTSAPDHDVIDCGFPIAGSNSSSTTIQRLNSDRVIKEFLTAPATGPDMVDPTLVDIGEYCVSIANNHDSCTDKFMQMFGLSYTALEKNDDVLCRERKVRRMFAALEKAGYEGLDYANPLYGQNKNMRYSELFEIYMKVTGKDKSSV